MKTRLALLALTFCGISWAHPIEGRWQTMDMETNKPRGEVLLAIKNGVLEGKVHGGKPKPGESEHSVCSKCEGALKDQPLLGMRILWDMREADGVFNGGRILDPDTGSIYKAQMTLAPDGKTVNVRGYVGLPTFGRSTVWHKLP